MWKYEQALREATVSCPMDSLTSPWPEEFPAFSVTRRLITKQKSLFLVLLLTRYPRYEMSVKILTRKHFMVKIWQPWAISKKNTSDRNQCSVDMTVKLLWQLYTCYDRLYDGWCDTCYDRWYNSCYVIQHYFLPIKKTTDIIK